MKKWSFKSAKVVYRNKLFRIRQERCIIPRTGKPYDYFYEDSPNWVNVVALTKTNKVILIKQYRHAVREFTIEIPGGIMDKIDTSPLAAVKRELLEETGYGGGDFQLIGTCRPNPAIINNKVYTYLARGVSLIGEPHPDSTEEIKVFEKKISEIDSLIRNGKISHSLVITAFYYAMPWILSL